CHSPFCLSLPPPPRTSSLFPYTTLFRSHSLALRRRLQGYVGRPAGGKPGLGRPGGRYIGETPARRPGMLPALPSDPQAATIGNRSEEHTSELQSLRHLVCRLLLEKTNKT